MGFFDDIPTEETDKQYEAIPSGVYTVLITNVKTEGNELTVETTISDGEWKGRKAWKNFNFDESNQYLNIQKGILKKDMEALGETVEGVSLKDTVNKLIGYMKDQTPIEAYMKSKEASNGKVYTNCYFNGIFAGEIKVPKSAEFDKNEEVPSVFD